MFGNEEFDSFNIDEFFAEKKDEFFNEFDESSISHETLEKLKLMFDRVFWQAYETGYGDGVNNLESPL